MALVALLVSLAALQERHGFLTGNAVPGPRLGARVRLPRPVGRVAHRVPESSSPARCKFGNVHPLGGPPAPRASAAGAAVDFPSTPSTLRAAGVPPPRLIATDMDEFHLNWANPQVEGAIAELCGMLVQVRADAVEWLRDLRDGDHRGFESATEVSTLSSFEADFSMGFDNCYSVTCRVSIAYVTQSASYPNYPVHANSPLPYTSIGTAEIPPTFRAKPYGRPSKDSTLKALDVSHWALFVDWDYVLSLLHIAQRVRLAIRMPSKSQHVAATYSDLYLRAAAIAGVTAYLVRLGFSTILHTFDLIVAHFVAAVRDRFSVVSQPPDPDGTALALVDLAPNLSALGFTSLFADLRRATVAGRALREILNLGDLPETFADLRRAAVPRGLIAFAELRSAAVAAFSLDCAAASLHSARATAERPSTAIALPDDDTHSAPCAYGRRVHPLQPADTSLTSAYGRGCPPLDFAYDLALVPYEPAAQLRPACPSTRLAGVYYYLAARTYALTVRARDLAARAYPLAALAATLGWIMTRRLAELALDMCIRHRSRMVLLIFVLKIAATHAADEGGDASGLKSQVFDGVNLSFMAWSISFSAWVAWKRPELITILSGAEPRPTPAKANAPTDDETKAIQAWDLLNVRLYGAIVSHVAAPLQAALYVDALNDGLKSMTYLRTRYGAKSSGDRAEATGRLQRSHIDSRAKLSEADVTHQYNEMQMAAADIVSSGGAKPDDALLISLLENALPAAYAQIRQMIRYKGHTVFSAYYNDLLTQVKAEVRSTSGPVVGAFSTTYMRGGKQKGPATPGRPGARTKTPGSNPCFNCLANDHTRDRCPHAAVICTHCGQRHVSELCPHGPGGPARDGLSANARRLLERAATKPNGSNSTSRPSSAKSSLDAATRAFLMRQLRQYQQSQQRSSSESPAAASSMPSSAPEAHALAATADDSDALDEFLASFDAQPHVFMCRHAPGASSCTDTSLSLIDSQATHFVVPSTRYLVRIIDQSPSGTVHTANGTTQAAATGVARVSLRDDTGAWHAFEVSAIVLPSCRQVLYSQRAMRALGVRHFLDDGYLVLPGGSRVTIQRDSYTVPLAFDVQSASALTARTSLVPVTSTVAGTSIAASSSNTGDTARTALPQQLLWTRLGFPSEHIWRHVPDVLRDHGLPVAAHLRYNFPMLDAVAHARSRALPFESMRDPDQIPAPGSMIYLDFAGPMIESYPHKFRFYCGAVDAGSGYSRLLACHGPTKEVASLCLRVLLSDVRSLMALSHPLVPNVVVTDQGSAFMSYHFRDFLADSQMRHWPSATYTPQQNAYVERMWGIRFAMARAMLAHARLGPSFHPFALQTANWVCNRLPSSSRGWLSPLFILSRRAASILHLRTFGCLARVTLPSSHREGDRHFSDRGLLGVYLGPSEQSPAAIIYVPSRRRFLTTRQVLFYEDVQPGINGVDSAWRELTMTTTAPPPSTNESPLLLTQADQPTGDPPSTPLSIVTQPLSTDLNMDVAPTALDPPRVPETPSSLAPSSARPRLPKRDTADSSDPSSRMFIRELPQRTTRQPRAYYVDPTMATPSQAIRNAVLRNHWLTGDAHLGAHACILSSIGGVRQVYIVTSTSDMGDIDIPRGYRQALASPEAAHWQSAIDRELDGLMANNTWDVVPIKSVPAGSNIMRCHMIFSVKRLADGTIDKFKCRLVADGNTQRYGVDFSQIFSTVAKLSTLRVFLAIAAANDWNLTSIDIRQAYLQATLHEDLYMQMPPSLPSVDSHGNKLVVKLRKSLYGLRQAGRAWANLLADALTNWGFTRSAIDTCLYTLRRGTSLLWVLVWVDDCVIVDSDPELRESFVKDLGKIFPVDDKGNLDWVLQVKVIRDRANRVLELSQQLYVADLLHRFGHLLNPAMRRVDCPCDAAVKLSPEQSPVIGSTEYDAMTPYRHDYMSLIGAFLWLANMTRYELSYISSQLARFVSNPGQQHFRAALRVLAYLQCTCDKTLRLSPNLSHPLLRIYVDSDWGTKFSVSGAAFEFMGTLVHWASKTQRSVSMSSTEAEFFATCLAARDGAYLREVLCDLGCMQTSPTVLRSDNKGVVDLSLDPVAFKKTKHILRAAEYLRDVVARRLFKVMWISGSDNVADLFTKSVVVSVFRHLMALLSRLHSL